MIYGMYIPQGKLREDLREYWLDVLPPERANKVMVGCRAILGYSTSKVWYRQPTQADVDFIHKSFAHWLKSHRVTQRKE